MKPSIPTRRPPAPHHVAIAVFGSRGDVYPSLALACELHRRGHAVTFATQRHFEEMVSAAGLRYRPLRPDNAATGITPMMHDPQAKPPELASMVREVIYGNVDDTYADLLAAAEGTDLLVFPMFMVAGPEAATRLGIPWAVTHFAAGTLNSMFDPPYLQQVHWLYPLQRRSPGVCRAFRAVARRAVRSWAKPLRALRAREGFGPEAAGPPLDPILDGLHSPWLTLALFSRLLGEPQPDWPQPTVQTGFPFFAELPAGPDAELQRFLEAGPAPLVATLGACNRRSFLVETIRAAQRLGRRLVLISGAGAAALRAEFAHEWLLIVDYAPYELLFARACALIVSGSVGTISQALRAGRPMLIVPSEAGDQGDNARRIVRQGPARLLRIERYRCDRAVRHLEALLTQPEFARAAARCAAAIAAEPGAAAACDALEALLAQGSPGEVRELVDAAR